MPPPDFFPFQASQSAGSRRESARWQATICRKRGIQRRYSDSVALCGALEWNPTPFLDLAGLLRGRDVE